MFRPVMVTQDRANPGITHLNMLAAPLNTTPKARAGVLQQLEDAVEQRIDKMFGGKTDNFTARIGAKVVTGEEAVNALTQRVKAMTLTEANRSNIMGNKAGKFTIDLQRGPANSVMAKVANSVTDAAQKAGQTVQQKVQQLENQVKALKMTPDKKMMMLNGIQAPFINAGLDTKKLKAAEAQLKAAKAELEQSAGGRSLAIA